MPEQPPERKRLPDGAETGKSGSGPTGIGATTGAIAPPDLTSSLRARSRSIRDAGQAQSIFRTLESASELRNKKNARIAAKYASEKPHTQAALEEEGLGWKSNFSTSPLVMLIDKVAPRFSQAVDGVKYLTNSSLPEEMLNKDGELEKVEGADKKTEAFRREITATVRARAGWKDFISSLAMENALFGFCALARLDEFSWFPKFFRQDNFYIPTGTKQAPNGAQIVFLRETFLVHELFSLIEDKEAAKTRGWNVPAVVKRLNDAIPEPRRSVDRNWERVYEDLRRESTLGTAFEGQPLTVTVIHCLATEIDGKVSHYIFNHSDFAELFTSEDQYNEMAEAVSFFSFQFGNGTLHGSRGIGRQIYAMAGILDRSRNEVVDRLNLAGKIIISGDDKHLRKFKMSLVGNCILIGSQFQISTSQVESAVEPFLQLDNFMSALLDQMAGSVSPKAIEGERVTKAAVDLLASREEESRDIVITRFLNQFSEFMTVTQKRMCDPDTNDKDAKEMQARLLKIMSKEELKRLANSPATETVKDYSNTDRQQLVLISQELQGNPLIDQKELLRRSLTARVNDEFAEAILLPDEDPTIITEQTRLQQLEMLLIVGQGTEVPVSPRDNHAIHLGILMPVLEQTAQQAVEDPNAIGTLQAVLAHASAHVDAAKAQGQPDSVKEFEPTLKKLVAAIPELNKNANAQQALAEGAQPGSPEASGANPTAAPV